MLYLRNIVATLAFGASVFGAVLDRRTAAQIKSGITDLSAKVTKLDTDVLAFPATGGSLLAALAIHTDSTNVDTSLKSLTTVTKNTTALSQTDGDAILVLFQALQPLIVNSLQHVVDKKPAFDGLPLGGVSGIVKGDIATLSADTKLFNAAIIPITPASDVPAAQLVIAAIIAAFDKAAAAYA